MPIAVRYTQDAFSRSGWLWAAVIGMAKTRGLVASGRDVFAALHQSDFRISAEVIRTVLTRVGE